MTKMPTATVTRSQNGFLNIKTNTIINIVNDVLSVIGLFLVYFCMSATTRVYGILLIALQDRFPTASMTALSSLSGVVSAVPYAIAPIVTVLLNKGWIYSVFGGQIFKFPSTQYENKWASK